MPKRKAAAAKLSGLVGSDDEGATSHNVGQEPRDNERPAKKARGRPRSKSAEMKPSAETKDDEAPAPSQVPETTTRKSTRRGRPKGSRNSIQSENQEATAEQKDIDEAEQDAGNPTPENAPLSNDELEAPSRSSRSAKPTKPATTRGRRKATADKQVKTDGEFEYTPKSTRQTKPAGKRKAPAEQPAKQQRRSEPESEPDDNASEADATVPDEVEETFIQDAPVRPRSISMSPTKRRQSSQPMQISPLKQNMEPELRRRLGELTKKHDILESRYRTLKEIGIVEANANMEKLRKQCEAMTNASNKLVSSLKAELEAQKALGQQSRALQRQLKERDAEITRLKSQAEDATGQLSSTQTEVKALQTKLAAARNTAANLETAAAKVPGSAIKGGSNRANAAANAEAAHAAQFAQLKEDLYTDLTGLIIRDVKKGETDYMYDCIQTGINGTLHFKLAVPHVSSVKFEDAEFQYIPLLDENRDRELIEILPEYLTVDITFVRQQASKFYTRVIDALTKRRTSTGN